MNNSLKWKPPINFGDNQHTSLYPIKSLPTIIKDAILAYQSYGQQPLPLIACSALANISLACQTMANVARDHMLVSPISVYFLIAAASGERKSAADKVFSAGIRKWQAQVRHELVDEVARSKLEHRTWQHHKDGLLKQIRRLASNGETTILEEIQLKELVANEPETILLPELFFEDVTQEALINQLANGWPSSSLWSDEGGIVISSPGMQSNVTKFVATINRLWDGNTFTTHRKTSANLSISNRRLTLSLMFQPFILEKLLTQNNGLIRQSGFLARSLITNPQSAMGERCYKEPSQSLPELQHFHQRITNCLNSSLELDCHGCKDIPTLTFSPQAKAIWVNFFNQIEQGLPHEWLFVGFASKSAENVARVAALFHLFESKAGSIQSESVEQAIDIITWHLHEAKRIINPEENTTIHNDAKQLLTWVKRKGLNELTLRYIQQNGPATLRGKTQLLKIIDLLIETNHVQMVKQDRKASLLVNPHSV